MKKNSCLILVVFTMFSIFVPENLIAQGQFYYASSAGHFIGQGKTVYADTSLSSVFMFPVRENDNSVNININGLLTNGQFYVCDVYFAAANGQEITPGLYTGCGPFLGVNHSQDKSSLSFVERGVSDPESSGYFNIHEISYGSGYLMNVLAVDFVQHSSGVGNEYVVGAIRYNSDIPINVPEPPTLGLIGLGLSVLLIYLLGRGKLCHPR